MNRPRTEGLSVLLRSDLLDYVRDQAHERDISISRVINECIIIAKQTAEDLEDLDD